MNVCKRPKSFSFLFFSFGGGAFILAKFLPFHPLLQIFAPAVLLTLGPISSVWFLTLCILRTYPATADASSGDIGSSGSVGSGGSGGGSGNDDDVEDEQEEEEEEVEEDTLPDLLLPQEPAPPPPPPAVAAAAAAVRRASPSARTQLLFIPARSHRRKRQNWQFLRVFRVMAQSPLLLQVYTSLYLEKVKNKN